MNRPSPGSMVYWRKRGTSDDWIIGYCTYVSGCDMVRMGRWNGDNTGGRIVSINDVEWRAYR